MLSLDHVFAYFSALVHVDKTKPHVSAGTLCHLDAVVSGTWCKECGQMRSCGNLRSNEA